MRIRSFKLAVKTISKYYKLAQTPTLIRVSIFFANKNGE